MVYVQAPTPPHYRTFHPTDATGITLGGNYLRLGTRTGAGAVATSTTSLFSRNLRLPRHLKKTFSKKDLALYLDDKAVGTLPRKVRDPRSKSILLE